VHSKTGAHLQRGPTCFACQLLISNNFFTDHSLWCCAHWHWCGVIMQYRYLSLLSRWIFISWYFNQSFWVFSADEYLLIDYFSQSYFVMQWLRSKVIWVFSVTSLFVSQNDVLYFSKLFILLGLCGMLGLTCGEQGKWAVQQSPWEPRNTIITATVVALIAQS